MDQLSDEQLQDGLQQLREWESDGGELRRTVELTRFLEAIQVVDQIAAEAERMHHHPDIDIRYATLTFRLTTHDAGGLTDSDLRLAQRIDEIVSGHRAAGIG